MAGTDIHTVEGYKGESMVTDTDKLASILERSCGTDVPVLLKAKEDAKRLVNTDPSSANLAALDRVQRMLRDAMDTQKEQENFKKVADILAHLKAQGRKISQPQLYKDIKLGYLNRQKDASFKKSDVERYAQTLKALALPEKEATELSDLARQESEERLAKMREQRLSIAFDRSIKQGKYIRRDDVLLELASRAAVLSVGLRSVFRLYAPELIVSVDGDTNKVEVLLEQFEKHLDAALHEYSRPMDFKVEYVPDAAIGKTQEAREHTEYTEDNSENDEDSSEHEID